MDRLKSTGACALRLRSSLAFCFVVFLGCRAGNSDSTELSPTERGAIVSNVVEEIGLPLSSDVSLVHVYQGARLNAGYREWVLFAPSATNLRDAAKAKVRDGDWVDNFSIDSAVAMIEASIKKKCILLPCGAAVGTFEDRDMTYQMIIVDVKDGAYLMVRRMPGP